MENFDFLPTGQCTPLKRFPITMSEAGPSETEEDRFSRFARSLGRCITSCSLCDVGRSYVSNENCEYDPHMQPSIFYKDVALIKYQPDFDDYRSGLFNNNSYRDIYKKTGCSADDFYRTTIIKCRGATNCPYFELEYLSNFPKLAIIFDKLTADRLGVEYDVGKFTNSFWSTRKMRYYFVDGPNKPFESILKLVALSKTDLSIHNRLYRV